VSDSTVDLTAVFEYIKTHQDEFIQRLIDYVSMPSISAHGIGIGEVADFLLERLQELGMDAQLMPTEGWPMVLGRRSDAPGAPTVLLYGHYDVQPPDPLDAWISPRLEGV
jgi:acetylornithine deacetylase/succinyl-diaminopimelate desuccinylase-like protein